MDDGGNLYKGRRPSESPPEYPSGGKGAGLRYWGTDPLPYVSYEKETNKSEQDWSDVINLTFQLNNSPNETYLEDVGQVVNIEQWLRALAMHEFLNDEADGLHLGFESVADEYAMYRGVLDPRFQMVPFDLDEMFINSSAPLRRFTGISALNRLVNHVDVLPEYGAQLWDIANVALTSDVVKSTLADVMGPIGLDDDITRIATFLDRRRDYVNQQLMAPVEMSCPGGYVDAGAQVTLSSPSAKIYYTVDGSDPRLPGGDVNPQAIEFTGQPIVIQEPTRIAARSYMPTSQFLTRWSGQTVEDFVAAPDLVVTELNYNPHVAQAGEFSTTDSDDFEYIELMNVGTNPLDLDGMKFVQVDVAGISQGIDFTFAAQTLAPDERIVVVKNVAAFQSRYGINVPIATGDDGQGGASGEYGGRLSNAGERVTLVGPDGVTRYSFEYDDTGKWPARADGGGSSLELTGLSMSPDGCSSGWHSSVERGGTPGSAGIGNTASVVINEIITNPLGLDVDAIEFYNPTGNPIDIGGMWLSDSLANLDRYVISTNTTVPAGDYLVLDQNSFGFGLNGTTGDEVVLVDPGTAGNPDLFITHISFGPALPGESSGRWPDGTGDLYPMISTTLGASNSGPRTGPLVISEIMYNPSSQLLEFVEIYNPSPLKIDLTGWTVGGIGYEFPAGTTIDPGQILVLLPFDPTLTALAADFDSEYGVDIAGNLSSFLGPYPGQLDNGGETLTLRRVVGDPASGQSTTAQIIEDQVDFDDTAPWPIDPDGTGSSLQRTRSDLWGNDSASWFSSNPTPGRLRHDRFLEFTTGATVIGEVGIVTDLTHEIKTIAFSQEYDNPVVLAQPASFNGSDPVVVRVTNVQSNQFEMFLAEPSNQNGLHGVGETAGYIVLEAGSHWLSDGTHLEVGTVDTSASVGANITSPSFQNINFTSLFANTPIVLSQPQTNVGELFLSTREDSITRGNFDVALEPEEQFGPEHVEETIGFLAIDPGTGMWNEIPIVAGIHSYVTQDFRTISYVQSAFNVVPSFLASLASYNGADNSHLRVRNADSGSIEVKLEEDTSVDEETGHTGETVAYLAIGGEGPLTTVSGSLIDGQTTTYQLHVADNGRLLDVDVNLDITHTRVGDLDIFLESPEGTMVELLAGVGAHGDNLTATRLDDDASQSITTAPAPFTGWFRPTGMLRDFAGENIHGTWTLHITDDVPNKDLGALLKWSLNVELGPEPEGNLNHDGQVDTMDIDLLFAKLGSDDPTYDMDDDGDVDRQDVDHLVQNILGRRFGDADLDQDVDIIDFNEAVINFDTFAQNAFYGWGQGNFDGDGDVDISDILQLVVNFSPLGYPPVNALSMAGFAGPPVTAAATPERALTVFGTERTSLADTSPVDVDRPHEDVKQNTTDHLFVDRYFRSSYRSHADPWKRDQLRSSEVNLDDKMMEDPSLGSS